MFTGSTTTDLLGLSRMSRSMTPSPRSLVRIPLFASPKSSASLQQSSQIPRPSKPAISSPRRQSVSRPAFVNPLPSHHLNSSFQGLPRSPAGSEPRQMHPQHDPGGELNLRHDDPAKRRLRTSNDWKNSCTSEHRGNTTGARTSHRLLPA